MSERCSSYTFGNCTAGVCALVPWIPDGLGDGGEWAANASRFGLLVVSDPVAGSVVSYCPGDGYSAFGHCAFVETVYPDGRFLVMEMNFTAFDVYDERVSTMGDVCGFILPPGGATGSGAGQVGPTDSNVAWDVAHEFDKLRWYWQTGGPLSLQHLRDVTSWLNGLR